MFMTTTGIKCRITNRAQLRGKIVLPTDIFLGILAEGLGGVIRGNDEAQGPPRGLLQRSSRQQDISQFSSLKSGALASFFNKSHIKFFISSHINFVVQLSEWTLNLALLLSPERLMEKQES